VLGRQPPGDISTPIMADDNGRFLPRRLNQAHHIPSQQVQRVLPDTSRFITQIVTPLVWNPHTVARLSQRRYLLPPAVPKLREAMQQNNQRPSRRSSLYYMQRNAIGFNVLMIHIFIA
jgi:hypothetical protein